MSDYPYTIFLLIGITIKISQPNFFFFSFFSCMWISLSEHPEISSLHHFASMQYGERKRIAPSGGRLHGVSRLEFPGEEFSLLSGLRRESESPALRGRAHKTGS